MKKYRRKPEVYTCIRCSDRKNMPIGDYPKHFIDEGYWMITDSKDVHMFLSKEKFKEQFEEIKC